MVSPFFTSPSVNYYGKESMDLVQYRHSVSVFVEIMAF